MAALATVADYETLTGTDVDAGAETERVERLLELASAAIERWCNRTFTYVEDEEITVYSDDGTLYLPNGPIQTVTSITGPSSPWLPAATEVDAAGWQEVRGHVIRRYGYWGAGSYDVVYTHGYETIPDAIVLAVCQMVQRMLTGPGGGIRSESIGEASFTYVDSWAGGIAVGPEEAALLAPYKVRVTSVQMVR